MVSNEKLLNINLVNPIDQSMHKHDLQALNMVINSNVSDKYRVVKYLGEAARGSLYLAMDKNNNRFVCKKITLDQAMSQSLNKQLHFELNVLRYLSTNSTTREHVNPCLEYSVIDNNIYTIFPVFDGYSLSHYKQYLAQLKHQQYYQLIFYLIKNILFSMAKIHKIHIAHQNINENAILISSTTTPKNLHIKFTDFGLGCGNIDKKVMNEYKDDQFFSSCKTDGNIPVIITPNIKRQLLESEFLQISQKYDLLCLGMIFLKMLLFFEDLDIDLSTGYNHEFIENVKRRILEKYFPKSVTSGRYRLNINALSESLDDIPEHMKNDILEYIKILLKYVFCKTNKRRNCQYVLDKIVIYEKYKNDLF